MLEVLKQAIDYIENVPDDRDNVGHIDRKALVLSLRQAIAELESQEPVACDGDFPEGFDKSLGIPAQALRQANAALCEVTNNRMWDVPALAERMLMFCRNTHPPQRKPLTDDQIYEMYNEPRSDAEMLEFARAIEAAHGIKE